MHPVLCTNTYHDIADLLKSWDGWKYKNLNILRAEHKSSMKQKDSLQMPHFQKLSFCSGGDL